MPQLMPLMWMSSSLMIFLLILVFINLYYEKIENLMMMKFEISFNMNNYMKW